MKDKLKLLIQLFAETFRLSLFTIGGGYVIIGFMKKRFVEQLGWLDEDEMLDYVSLAQSCPGVIAVNASVLTGYRLGGFAGVVSAVVGTVLPPMIILSIITLCYEAFSSNTIIQYALRGMQAGVAALMADVIISSCAKILKQKNIYSIIIMIAAFCCVMFLNINAAWVILIGGAAGVVLHYVLLADKKKKQSSGTEKEAAK